MSRGLFGLTSIYTRRQAQKDVFFNDPFKIQSYNFRYADRPAYPMQHYQRPSPSSPSLVQQPKPPIFETYYRNPKFITSRSPTSTPTTTAPLSAFAEHRRRQFLQDFKCMATPMPYQANPTPIAPQRNRPFTPLSNNPLLRTCCNRDEYQTIRRDQSVSTIGQSCLKQPARNYNTSTIRRSASGCAININMSDHGTSTELDKRLSIQIETDNNTNNFKVKETSNPVCAPSSSIFVIDKRLSKFNFPTAPNISSERTPLIAKRQSAQSDKDHLHQLKLQIEQQSVRVREEERERLRQLERKRAREHLQEVQRLRELERETERKRVEQEKERQQRLSAAAVLTAQLSRQHSKVRLPGMAPFNIQQHSVTDEQPKPLANRQEDQAPITLPPAPDPLIGEAEPARSLERRCSDSSSNNASVSGCESNASLHNLSNPRPSEHKLLNLYGNRVPVCCNQPIHTRINNMPIRITSTQPVRSHGQARLFSPFRLGGSNNAPYNVNINVYADNLRTMRL